MADRIGQAGVVQRPQGVGHLLRRPDGRAPAERLEFSLHLIGGHVPAVEVGKAGELVVHIGRRLADDDVVVGRPRDASKSVPSSRQCWARISDLRRKMPRMPPKFAYCAYLAAIRRVFLSPAPPATQRGDRPPGAGADGRSRRRPGSAHPRTSPDRPSRAGASSGCPRRASEAARRRSGSRSRTYATRARTSRRGCPSRHGRRRRYRRWRRLSPGTSGCGKRRTCTSGRGGRDGSTRPGRPSASRHRAWPPRSGRNGGGSGRRPRPSARAFVRPPGETEHGVPLLRRIDPDQVDPPALG
jgi:hypothetical protein